MEELLAVGSGGDVGESGHDLFIPCGNSEDPLGWDWLSVPFPAEVMAGVWFKSGIEFKTGISWL